jgi:hypothetical protein
MQHTQIDKKKYDYLFKDVGGKLYQLNLAIKQGKIKPVPVTRGSYWKSIYRFAVRMGVSLNDFDLNETAWHKLISECQNTRDDTLRIDQEFASYTESARTTLHEQYGRLFARYLTISFYNQGFPWRTSGHKRQLSAFIHCVSKFSVVQLICLIKQHETGSLDERFLYELIYTVERGIDHKNVIFGTLDEDPDRLKLDRYQACFSDFF